MASTPKRDLSDSQRLLQRSLDAATDSCIAYAAREIPALGNLTPEGLTEELGRLNEARKAVEKTEKIVRGRLDALLAGKKKCRSDNFEYEVKSQTRTALNQGKAKEVLAEIGQLDDCMSTTETEVRTVKRI